MLISLSEKLFQELALRNQSIVFCESCTAGMAAATLGRFPGVSKVLAGSLVVYQTETKHDWLQLSKVELDDPNIGPVSEIVTRQLAAQTLAMTSSADLAAAVTGHLGPPASIAEYDAVRLSGSSSATNQSLNGDGTVFVAIAAWKRETTCQRFMLQSPTPTSTQDHAARYERQVEATLLVYRSVLQWLQRV